MAAERQLVDDRVQKVLDLKRKVTTAATSRKQCRAYSAHNLPKGQVPGASSMSAYVGASSRLVGVHKVAAGATCLLQTSGAVSVLQSPKTLFNWCAGHDLLNQLLEHAVLLSPSKAYKPAPGV